MLVVVELQWFLWDLLNREAGEEKSAERTAEKIAVSVQEGFLLGYFAETHILTFCPGPHLYFFHLHPILRISSVIQDG